MYRIFCFLTPLLAGVLSEYGAQDYCPDNTWVYNNVRGKPKCYKIAPNSTAIDRCNFLKACEVLTGKKGTVPVLLDSYEELNFVRNKVLTTFPVVQGVYIPCDQVPSSNYYLRLDGKYPIVPIGKFNPYDSHATYFAQINPLSEKHPTQELDGDYKGILCQYVPPFCEPTYFQDFQRQAVPSPNSICVRPIPIFGKYDRNTMPDPCSYLYPDTITIDKSNLNAQQKKLYDKWVPNKKGEKSVLCGKSVSFGFIASPKI